MRASEPDKKPSVSVLFSSNSFRVVQSFADTFGKTQMGDFGPSIHDISITCEVLGPPF